jgi:hypothetical protein
VIKRSLRCGTPWEKHLAGEPRIILTGTCWPKPQNKQTHTHTHNTTLLPLRSEEAGDVARFRQGAMAEAKWLQSLKGSYVPTYYGGCPAHEVTSIPALSKAPARLMKTATTKKEATVQGLSCVPIFHNDTASDTSLAGRGRWLNQVELGCRGETGCVAACADE